jgi:competence protein ComEC
MLSGVGAGWTNVIRRSVRAGVAFLAAMLVAAQPVFAADVKPSERVKRNVVVREQPDGDSATRGALFPGDEAKLLDEVAGWYHVKLPDGRTGYVSKSWTVVVPDTGQPLVGASGSLKIHVIDIGTGLAVFIEGPGFTMLYDGGSQDDLATAPDNRIVAYIKAVRPDVEALDHLILSHPHKDHLELLPDVFDRFVIHNVWDSGAVNKTRGYCRFLKKVAAEPGVQYHDAIATGGTHRVTFTGKGCSGEVAVPEAAQMTAQPVTLGPGAAMTILYRDAVAHPDPNENTVVVRLDFGQRRVLLAGDAEGGERMAPTNPPAPNSIEGKLLACCAADLRSDVLVVGHHGSLTSSRQSFLNAVQAKIFVISSGPHPYSKKVLPDPEIEAELITRGQLFQTDVDDELCEADVSKIGPDADESPGGCDNVVVTIQSTGQVTAAYNRNAD